MRYGRRAVVAAILLAECALQDLADGRLRDDGDELEAVGKPPLRKLRREKGAQLLAGARRAFTPNDYRERPLVPPRVWHADHGRLEHSRMAGECRLERDRADPLPARLDHVL